MGDFLGLILPGPCLVGGFLGREGLASAGQMSTVRSQVRPSTARERETAPPGRGFAVCNPAEKEEADLEQGRAGEVNLVLEKLNLTTEHYETNTAGDAVHTGKNVNASRGKASPALPTQQATRPRPTSCRDGKQQTHQALVPLFPAPSFKRKYENRKENKKTLLHEKLYPP